MQALSLETSGNKNTIFLSTKNSISIPIAIPIPKNSISIPIAIPIPKNNSFESDLTEEYSLQANIFNPGKMSPPNYWKCRLEQRIKDHPVFKLVKK